jgi:hypothetical protein
MTENETKPSCFYCTHAILDPGYSGSWDEPPSPPMAECQNDKVSEDLLDSGVPEGEGFDKFQYEEYYASKCGHFNPRLIEKCMKCDEAIDKPEYSWTLWAGCWEMEPVCSEECKVELEEEFIRQMTRVERSYEDA